MGDVRNMYLILVGNTLLESDQLDDAGTDRRITLNGS